MILLDWKFKLASSLLVVVSLIYQRSVVKRLAQSQLSPHRNETVTMKVKK